MRAAAGIHSVRAADLLSSQITPSRYQCGTTEYCPQLERPQFRRTYPRQLQSVADNALGMTRNSQIRGVEHTAINSPATDCDDQPGAGLNNVEIGTSSTTHETADHIIVSRTPTVCSPGLTRPASTAAVDRRDAVRLLLAVTVPVTAGDELMSRTFHDAGNAILWFSTGDRGQP